MFPDRRRHIFIGGSVGVGKTTTLNGLTMNLCEKGSIFFIKEYIDFKPTEGKKKLEDFNRGHLPCYEFQQFILECFQEQINSIEYEVASICIWERHPAESLMFMKQSVDSGKTEKQELKLFKNDLKRFFVKNKIPKLDHHLKVFKIDTYLKDEELMMMIIKSSVAKIFLENKDIGYFFLFYCSNEEEQLRRIHNRGREIEKQIYPTVKEINILNKNYYSFLDKIFN